MRSFSSETGVSGRRRRPQDIHELRSVRAFGLLGCTAVSLTVVGSIALDSVRTPFGERERMLGGSAVHFALAASFFADVHVVGPVGDDFPDEHVELLRSRGVNVDDIERVSGGETFRWRGHYEVDMNLAHTDDTELGVFADFEPKLSRGLERGRRALPGKHPARPAATGASAVQPAAGGPRLDEPVDRDHPRLAASRRSARSTVCS